MRQVYDKHTRQGSFETVMQGLQRSRLSARTKAKLPTDREALTTLRNAHFLLTYWRTAWAPGALDSMQGFGFRYGPNRSVEWDD